MTNSYSGNPADSAKDAVRFWIQDTSAPWKMSDEEINYVVSKFTNPMLAAANVARALAAKYAAYPSKTVGDFSINWGELARNYAALAAELESQGQTFGLRPYSGGTSLADMVAVASNPDRPKPPFWNGQFSNNDGFNGTTEPGWDDQGPA